MGSAKFHIHAISFLSTNDDHIPCLHNIVEPHALRSVTVIVVRCGKAMLIAVVKIELKRYFPAYRPFKTS